jgi:Formin Homology 2 Domain
LFFLVNLQDVRKGLTELRDGLKAIRQELNEYFSDVEQNDRYSKQMWGFLGKATRQMEDLNDDVNAADTLFTEVVKYFGEDDKNMSSTEFYGVFKTFITSYRVRDFTSPLVQIFDDGGETEMPDGEQNSRRGEARAGEAKTSR